MRFRFTRMCDVFTPDDMPSESVNFAVVVGGEYRSGHGPLVPAIIQAAAWLTIATFSQDVVIACRDIREVTR